MEDEDESHSRRLQVLYLIQGMMHFVGGLLGPVYAVFVTTIGGDVFSAGLTYGVYMASMGAFYVAFGRIADRLGTRGLVAFLGILAQSLLVLGYLFVKTPLELAILQVAMGIAGAMHTPAVDALVSTIAGHKKTATIWGGLESVEDISYGFASVIGASVAYYLGFEYLFGGMALIGLVAAMIMFNELARPEIVTLGTAHPLARLPMGEWRVAAARARQ